MKSGSRIVTCWALLAMVGCGTTRQVVEAQGVKDTFQSNLSSQELARCMVRGVDGRGYGSIKAHLEPGQNDRLEIIVRGGDNIWSIAEIKPSQTGSSADLYYGSAGTMFAANLLKWMTEGCS